MNLNNYKITDLKEKLIKKEISCTEIIKEYLDRIKKLNSKLNAFITISEVESIKTAQEVDKKIKNNENLPLLGIPIGLKDLFLTKGIRTTAASRLLMEYLPQYDATVVGKLKNAGAVIIGKLNCDAWAHGSTGENSDFKPTKNPWDVNFVPGGSSSGSAVSVAANMCVASTGTDTGGSIRLPASFCNTVGLKPTYGLVSRYGIIAMASSLDSIGHFTKSVKDSAFLLNVTSGKDKKDATSLKKPCEDYLENIDNNIANIRIGIPKEYFSQGLDPNIKKKVFEALTFFEKNNAKVFEISLPHTEYAIACYYIIQPAEVSSNLARYDGIRYGDKRELFGDEAKRRIILGTFTLSSGYYDAYYKKAMQVRTLIKRDFDNAFKKVDVIIAPVSPTLPWKIGEKINDPLEMYLSDAYTVTANLAGVPALSVPIGFHKNLPIGMQIIGPHFSEKLLFQAGNFYEKNNQNNISPKI